MFGENCHSTLLVIFAFLIIEITAETKPRSNLVLLVSFDGFRWDYLNRGLTPTFNEIAAAGGRTEYITNAYVTKTFPDHYTIVTGLHEESHGIIGNHMYDPLLNDTFSLGNHDPKWWSQNGQVQPIWITNQIQGGSSAVVDWPGMNIAFDGILPDYEHPKYDSSLPFNDSSDMAVSLLATGSVNFVALYYKEPDHAGHLSGPDSKELNDTLRYCDRTLKYLKEELEAANLWDNVNIIITSDHGMMAVDINKTIYADRYLNETGFPYITTENNPLVGIWPREVSHTEALYEAMRKAPHVTVFKKEDIPEEYQYKNNVRTPPIVAAAYPGWMLLGTRSEGNYKKYKGNHGYSNSLADMHPLFIIHGPAIRSGSTCEPFDSVDIYPLMSHLLMIEGRPNNGTLEKVGALLKNPPGKSLYFAVGISVAVLIGLIAILIVVGICLRQMRSDQRSSQDVFSKNDGGQDVQHPL